MGFYQKQRKKISNELESLGINIVDDFSYQDSQKPCHNNNDRNSNQAVSIKTVDGFQGSEKDVIIISCVRSFAKETPSSNIGGGIGFLSDEKRLNVALTRARFSLYIVGNLETLKVNTMWRSLLEDATERGVVENVKSIDTDLNRLAQSISKINI